jgi:hypothetical protein
MNAEVAIPIATLVLGLILGHLFDWLKERRAESRDRKARYRAFQRQAIMDVQDAVWELFINSGRNRISASEYSDEHGKWPSADELGVDESHAMHGLELLMKVRTLATRVDDEEMQTIITSITKHPRQLTFGESDEASRMALAQFSRDLNRLNNIARELLADLY